MPEAVCYHQDRSKEYLLITEVPGFAAMETGWDKKKVVCRLAEGLRRIHSLPIDSCPFVYPTGALIRLAAERIRAGLVDEEDFDECRKGKRAEELYEELVRSRPARDDLVFTHGDYCLPNVILSDSGIGGFIDWGRRRCGGPLPGSGHRRQEHYAQSRRRVCSLFLRILRVKEGGL